jgi:acetyl-CoA/propionyl-CoA carboxylase biotin carboxyl carrier protein
LKSFQIEGVASVLPFHRAVLEHADFTEDFKVHTRWIEQDLQHDFAVAPRSQYSHQNVLQRYPIEIDGKLHQVEAALLRAMQMSQPVEHVMTAPKHQPQQLLAPINGVISSWKVTEQDQVQEGDVVGVMEAMKMEVPILAHSGRIQQLAATGQTLHADQPIAEIV